LGPPDERLLAPLLLEARARQVHAAYAQHLLGLMGIPEIKAHPGYRLTVQAFGAFRVWRGSEELAGREWQRDKARQLFQLLLAERGGRWLQRDQIVERLWPQLAPDAAVRDFKVALNALNRALEPASTVARAFYFVEREGTAYRLRPEADIWFDAAQFEGLCERGLRGATGGAADDDGLAALRAALDLYGGDYLPDALYDDWAAEQRERLLTLYLRAADRLAETLIARGEVEEGLDICQSILARDACWEHAYQLMMQAYARQGNRGHALRVYARCVDALRAELDAPPSAETTRLYRQLVD
jgi:DNA-binding SARP family transcriptional activator